MSHSYIVAFSIFIIFGSLFIIAVLSLDSSSAKQHRHMNTNVDHLDYTSKTSKPSIRKKNPISVNTPINDVDWDDPDMNSLIEQFICCVVLKWREYPYIDNVAYLTEFLLYEIAMQAIIHNAESDNHVRNKAKIIAISILKWTTGSKNKLYVLEKIYNDRFQSYRKGVGTAKKHEYLYRFCRWSSQYGHNNAVFGNYEPKINFRIRNIPMEDFLLMTVIDNVNMEMNHTISITFDAFLMTGGIGSIVKSIIKKHSQVDDRKYE